MLKNERSVAKIGVDTAEIWPPKIWRNSFVYSSHSLCTTRPSQKQTPDGIMEAANPVRGPPFTQNISACNICKCNKLQYYIKRNMRQFVLIVAYSIARTLNGLKGMPSQRKTNHPCL